MGREIKNLTVSFWNSETKEGSIEYNRTVLQKLHNTIFLSELIQKVSDENDAINVTLIVADAVYCIIMIRRQAKYQLFWHSDSLYCDWKIYWSSLKLVSDFSKIDGAIIKTQTDLDT